MSYQRRGELIPLVALVVGCLSLSGAVLVARAHPPSGYEASIYGATPLAFWVGIGVAWVVSLAVAMGTADRALRWVATTLGGAGAVAVVGLPLVRGYHFHASSDSLSHLGWIRDLGVGRIAATEMLYPGVHSLSVMTSNATGLGYPRATMLVVVAFAAGFFLAVPATVWALTGSDLAAVVGAFSAFMLLPINLVVTQPVVHPISQASLFVAVTLYLVVRYVTSAGGDRRLSPTGLGVALALSSVGLVLYHPQAAMAFLVVLGTVSAVQFLARRRHDGGPVTGLRPVYAQTALLALAFLAWGTQQPAVTGTVDLAVRTTVAFVSGEALPVAGEVSQRGGSLSAIGSSLVEVYLKLMLVSTVYGLLGGLLFLGSATGGVRGLSEDVDGVVRVLGLGVAALSAFAVFHFLGSLSGLVYRYTSILMTVLTVLGAVALYRFTVGVSTGDSGTSGASGASGARTAALVLGLAVMLFLSVPTVFASPYVYQPSSHVTEQRLDGYGSAFEYAAPDTEFVGIRGGVHRNRHAVQGTTGNPWRGESLDPAEIDADLGTASPTDRYLVVTDADYEREVGVYRELRYTRADFRTIATRPGIDRVQSNGGFDLYYDRGDEEEAG